ETAKFVPLREAQFSSIWPPLTSWRTCHRQAGTSSDCQAHTIRPLHEGRNDSSSARHAAELDRDPSNIAIKIDFANAFNSIPRKHLLDELYRRPELTSMFHLIHWAYSQPSLLLVRDAQGEMAALLVRQGCVLGSLAFGIATLSMLTKLKKSYKDIDVV